jgi:hypothetical protein
VRRKRAPVATAQPLAVLPASLPPVPGEQQIREAIIDKTRHRQHHRVTEQRGQPAFAGRHAPDRNHNVGADDQAAGFVGRVQAAADVVERGAVESQRLRLFVDVLKGKIAGAACCAASRSQRRKPDSVCCTRR